MRKFLVFTLFLFSSAAFAANFSVSSHAYEDGKTVPSENVFNNFGCTGKNISPDVTWSNPPKGTKSFAITIYDPDAPTGSGWWHWTVFNIPASTKSIPAGASSAKLPNGAVEGRTDFGTSAYGGPCPPPGDKPHRYILTVYALKVPKLDLDKNASGAMVGFNLPGNTLAKASVTAKYGRK